MRRGKGIALAVLVLLVGAGALQGAEPAVEELVWPRVHQKGDLQVVVYQPQVDSWEKYQRLHFRAALAVSTAPASAPAYGIVEVDAMTVVDTGSRIAALVPAKRELRFPNASEPEAAALRKVVDEVVPMGQALTLSLDQVLAYVDASDGGLQREVELDLDPPRIFFSRRDAILLLFLGKPRFAPVEPGRTDLEFALNTNWDLFRDPATGSYFLLDGESWLTAPDAVAGPWQPAGKLPAALSHLPDGDNWSSVRANVPGAPIAQVPAVYAATEPAELIVTEGDPGFAPIPGTALRRVVNTDSILFQHALENRYYFLVAGRWFRAERLTGPWTAASRDLPVDFGRIPDDDPAAYVKASVPGTQEARDAVMLASVPTATAVENKPVTVEVAYSGEPRFEAVEATGVETAVNTSEAVFRVAGAYYWCSQGTWLTSSQAKGPWSYATMVPQAIYSIPPSHPSHNVTYVTVESSSPTQVVYSQTSGYSGEYVAATGVLMFGAGVIVGALLADDDHCDHCYYYPPPPTLYSYGCAAHYHYGYGGYYSSARYNGPYGGAGRTASYNPYTGTYGRSAYAYGPRGAAGVSQAYNPYTQGYARAGRVDTAYGSAGRFYAEQGGRAAAGGYRSNAYGTAGAVVTNQGTGVAGANSARGSAVAWDTRASQGAAARSSSGDVYVGNDGNVYRREQGGSWSQYQGSGDWNSVSASSPHSPSGAPTRQQAQASRPEANQQTEQQAEARRQQASSEARSQADAWKQQAGGGELQGRAASQGAATSNDLQRNLDAQAKSRDWSSAQGQRTQQFQSSMSSRSRSPRSRGGRPGGR